MNTLWKQSLLGFVKLEFFLAGLIFLPAWSLDFWQGWVYWSLFSVCVLLITLYFLKYDPRLIERRLKVGPVAERRTSQKIIQAIGAILFCSLLVIPGFDHRFGWSMVPIAVVLSANVVLAVTLLTVFLVFKENSHTAATVTVETDQQVITTGPYRIVRHPMYAGGVLGFLATPLALGSLWGLLVAIPLCGVIVARLLDEERYLSANLSGYDAYCHKVRPRLVPLVW